MENLEALSHSLRNIFILDKEEKNKISTLLLLIQCEIIHICIFALKWVCLF